jgi:uncharacterized membrane protein YhaH (DUF805 family)
MNWYLKVLKNYTNFSGRARRKEYWMFTLFNVIFAVSAMLVDNLLGLAFEGIGYGPVYGLYVLATIVPGIAVGVRRLHDLDKSGWMMLIGLIPLIGAIWLLVQFVKEGTPGDNQYGPNPKTVTD